MREMRDSGIEWIGEIPVNWAKTRIGNLFRFSSGDSLTNEEIQDEGLYKVYGANGPRGYYHHTNLTGKHILIGRVGALCGNIHVVDEPVWVTEHALIAEQISPDVCTDFAGRVFESMNLGQYSKASAQPVIASSVVQRLQIPIPPSLEQRRIADYLDRKCSQIDAIIARQQEVIEKLKAYKLSKINEIVVEVEGITAHLGYVANMKNGLNFNVVPDGKTLKFLGVGDFKDHYVLDSEEMFSDILVNNEITSEYMLQSGDIIFVRSNGSKELVGRAVMVENVTFPLSYSGFCIRIRNLRTDILNSKYLLYFFRSPYFRKQLEKYSQGSNITNINQVLLSQISIIIPPFEVQLEAIKKVEKLLAAIDKLITGKQEIVSALERYKKSLIYEVVTGKKEV